MEKWKVVGWRDVDFKDQSSGKQVTGTTLFLYGESDDPKVHGFVTQKLFISKEYVKYDPVLNQQIGINFNRYGKVQSIEVL